MMSVGRKVGNSMLDALFGTKLVPLVGGPRTLGIYDTAGKRRYWMWLPPVPPATSGKIEIGPIPELVVDEAFTLGWGQIDDAQGNMLMKIDIDVTARTFVTGTILKLDRLTMKID